jgi:stage II sporulation protein AB (anti-sigma F factor)
MENYMKLELTAIGENESFARSAVAAFALPLNPSLNEISDIKTAVSEAVTNCVVHAYRQQGGKILIECKLSRNEGREGGVLHISVTDYGCGIDNVEQATLPFFTTLTDSERSGMGFTIMQTFMDEFSLKSEKGKGTCVTMLKRVVATENKECREKLDA